MRNVFNSYGRAFLSQLHGKMLLLSVLPFLLSLVLWGALLWVGLQPLIDNLHALFTDHDFFHASGQILAMVGLGMLKTVVVPLIAMFLLLPLMILTALIFMGLFAMPVISRHVGGRHFPQLEKKHGGSLLGSVGTALATFVIFILAWLVLLPLYVFPPAALVAQAVLWGWLTYRVMAYDALADYATTEERQAVTRARRWPLLAIGMVSGAAGSVPGLLWMGGVMSVVFFPFIAAFAIWLYVLIFIFTGLWFQYYCLEALSALRGLRGMRDVAPADL
ncbi:MULTISPECIES: EI24 domain-containing protein [unclassified Janthinobacterium]|uniref:EI24 domain-containing protein n=1 Tax=unclassified Janthinobacterium TaxID=2610881 RepID=UPI001608AC43|nr:MULTISPECIES: EI24 domain-containing protein [unclassified Janthinobacterium]MBB5370937.1 putative membrane protein [Janthinobacterium sp. K2C7]MBB5383743.1 putative membrane protein [Janthinobacterium sp. K2Li3]MBB5388248.1 putative membrane protein [Janthinobacterium sp. K2E3]